METSNLKAYIGNNAKTTTIQHLITTNLHMYLRKTRQRKSRQHKSRRRRKNCQRKLANVKLPQPENSPTVQRSTTEPASWLDFNQITFGRQ